MVIDQFTQVGGYWSQLYNYVFIYQDTLYAQAGGDGDCPKLVNHAYAQKCSD